MQGKHKKLTFQKRTFNVNDEAYNHHLHEILSRQWWLCLHATIARTLAHNLLCEINARSRYVKTSNELKMILAGVEERCNRLIRDFEDIQVPNSADVMNDTAEYVMKIVMEAISVKPENQLDFLEKVRILAAEYGTSETT